ncbi:MULTISPECIES: hypothetical protein [unclassified Methanoregula]|uniref:hypothetical protein n=1 Tax=unclassified Methanoregula TaxID=2649730 RepID=UPI0009D31C5B|nr:MULTISPECIES: hypothetical protein [unclassified Methanoregula]OPX64878.1 MAG: hypothetical protein A4E33_00616 [Methanoregula sp. PtaB.Bin085]OPY32930.1 MAG: hypothetical protein A4E34_02307 [Methanoregula sp. PtaU1.Bin006]
MKKGRKTGKEDTGSGKAGDDDPGSFKITGDMIGANPDGIDAIRLLQIIAAGIAAVVLGWAVLDRILNVI